MGQGSFRQTSAYRHWLYLQHVEGAQMNIPIPHKQIQGIIPEMQQIMTLSPHLSNIKLALGIFMVDQRFEGDEEMRTNITSL